MVDKRLLEKLNAGVSPIRKSANVFTMTEYAAAAGIPRRSAWDRVNQLFQEGKVRKVRTKRDGRIVPGWEYIGK